jgi:hypothetical protein
MRVQGTGSGRCRRYMRSIRVLLELHLMHVGFYTVSIDDIGNYCTL